jgi:hypothetical protein
MPEEVESDGRDFAEWARSSQFSPRLPIPGRLRKDRHPDSLIRRTEGYDASIAAFFTKARVFPQALA